MNTLVLVSLGFAMLALVLGGLAIHLSQFKASSERLQKAWFAERERADAAVRELARLTDVAQRLAEKETDSLELNRQLRQESVRSAELAAKLSEASDARVQMQIAHDQLKADIKELTAAQITVKDELAQASAQRDAAADQLRQVRAWLDTAKDSLRTSFIEAASGVFDEKSVLLDQRIIASGDVAKEHMQSTLKPLAEQVAAFQKQVGDFTEKQRLDAARLDGTISRLMDQNLAMATAADSLTKALKGNVKARGDWGEMILETVLKASGLESGRHYVAQANAKDVETGATLRPDVVVNFPDNRQVAVDAKVNLIAWAAYNDAQTHEDQQAALIAHTAALRKHVNDLAGKNYPKAIGERSLDLTVLFVPIEGAMAAALASNPTLQNEAWSKGIAFASPNTLMALLKVAERMWVRDQLQKQVGVIGQYASQLLDTVSSFLVDFEAVEGRIQALSRSYADAKNRLFESNQSVVARTKRLVDAGARGKKRLHDALQPTLDDASAALPLLPAAKDSEGD